MIRRIRMQRKKSIASSRLRKAKSHTIDGIHYASGTLARYHEEFKANPLITSFRLPQINDKEKRSKFGAKKAEINGIIFDSLMEARYYVYLLQKRHDKGIKSFECQKKFVLQEKYKDRFTGKTILPITYVADFYVIDRNGQEWAIDVKGQETPEFRIKWKMMGKAYPDIARMCVQWVASTDSWEDLENIKRQRKAARQTKTKTKRSTSDSRKTKQKQKTIKVGRQAIFAGNYQNKEN